MLRILKATITQMLTDNYLFFSRCRSSSKESPLQLIYSLNLLFVEFKESTGRFEMSTHISPAHKRPLAVVFTGFEGIICTDRARIAKARGRGRESDEDRRR